MVVTISSLNIHGLTNDTKRQTMYNTFLQSKSDIICLQETHCLSRNRTAWQDEWPGMSYWNPGPYNSKGLAILFKPSFKGEIISSDMDFDSRVLTVNVKLNDFTFNITTIYAPNTESRLECEQFFEFLDDYIPKEMPTILCGDFNMVENLILDRQGGNPREKHTWGLHNLKILKQKNGLTDIWRKLNPQRKFFTWHSYYEKKSIKSRLDRFYISNTLSDLAQKVGFSPCSWSDHTQIDITLTVPDPCQRGSGYWKFNTQLLRDDEYVKIFKDFWAFWTTKKGGYPDLQTWWDIGKIRIKQISIEYSTNRARRRKRERTEITSQIEALQSQGDYEVSALNRLKERLKQYEKELAEKICVRTKIDKLEEEEKPTHFFYKNLKKRQQKTNFSEVYTNDTHTTSTSDHLTILSKATTFYKNLYTADPGVQESRQDELLKLIDRQIKIEEKMELDRKISKNDLLENLRETENMKAPGLDGLPFEFYKAFWNTIGDDFYELTNSIFDSGRLTESQKVALISLLAKDGDKKDLDNWRPLSLLCTDYKIIAKTIATKIKQVLPSVIHEDQSCSVPGRSIHNNLMLTRDILSYTSHKRIRGYIITVDQAKAFDMVHRGLVERILKKMNFGEDIMKWVHILYSDTKSALYINGYIGEFFSTTRGVRQGCPLSAILYVTYAEALGQLIRTTDGLVGMPLPGTKERALLSQYADDTTFFLHHTTNLQILFDTLTTFEKLTGSRIKRAKTKGLLLHCDEPSVRIPITWSNLTGVKILGITFFTDYLHTVNFNWLQVINSLDDHLEDTKSRQLSYRGKVLNINTLGLANFWYLAAIYAFPIHQKKRAEKLIFDYLYDYKTRQPIKRDTLYLPKESGGLGIFQPWTRAIAIRTKFIKFITDPTCKIKWVYIARYYTGFSLGPLDASWNFLRSNLLPKPDNGIRPRHYDDILLFISTLKIPDIKWEVAFLYAKKIEQTQIEPTAIQSWTRDRNIPYTWAQFWPLLHFSYASAKKQQMMYKFIHRALPTKDAMSRWNGHHPDPNCDFCKTKRLHKRETMLHLFFDCPKAYGVWRLLKPVLHVLIPDAPVQCYYYTFGIFPASVTRPLRKLVITLIQSCLYYVWLARNDYHIEKKDNDPKLLFDKIKRDFTVDVKCLFKKFGTNVVAFRRQFCTNNLIYLNGNNYISIRWP